MSTIAEDSKEQELAEAVKHFERDGYALFENVLDADLMAEAKQHIEWLMQKNPTLRPENLGHTLVADDPFWVRLISDPRLLDIAEQFIGPDIALFASSYICKPPFDGKPVLWHQDRNHWPLDPMEVVTLWLAVDDATPENGCMRVIPGTHRLDDIPRTHNAEVDSVLGAGIHPSLFDATAAVDCVLKSGGVEVHHPNIIHGSEPNNSPLRRGGLTIHYIPTSTRITQNPWPCAFLLRGDAVSGVNEYVSKPKYVEGRHMPFRGCELPRRESD